MKTSTTNCPWCGAPKCHSAKLYVNWECRSNYICYGEPYQSDKCKIRVLERRVAELEKEVSNERT